jgi:hypothetical protein
MRLPIHMLAALALVAGCSKGPATDNARAPAETRTESPPAQAQATTTTTPANVGQPGSHEEKKEGANPQQGQVDPKAPEQHRDFQMQGDQKGPTGPDTQPKRGG